MPAACPPRSATSKSQPTDMTKAPRPRFDLLKVDRYASGALQYSRGCPFQCEFCDIIVIYGRRPRVKDPDQLVAELDDMRRPGFHSAFIVDDNFIGDKKKAKALLEQAHSLDGGARLPAATDDRGQHRPGRGCRSCWT